MDGREDCWCARQKPGSAPGQKSRVGLRRHLRPRESRPAARCLCEACA
ncbi:cysteine-rich CWC family protein [Pseudomonas chlororaphis]|uniref:Cysteine-rich CWC family protein n=1 Tax=Pseudomonas chlororaphis TaxID=587753 RepID=A0AAP9VX07_9PSED|nr:cysteine-rich CWC family protein [Pseudomonas chlororaphis]